MATLCLAGGACDWKLVSDSEAAVYDPNPGPKQGLVGDEGAAPTTPTPDEPTTPDDPGTGPGTNPNSPPNGPAGPIDPLARINAVRALHGVEAMTENAALTDASFSHATFVAVHWDTLQAQAVSPHREVDGLDGFSGVTGSARADSAGYEGAVGSEVIAFQTTPAAAIEAWLETLYHRLPLLRQDLTEIGYADAATDSRTVNVAMVGRPLDANVRALEPTDMVVYPFDGATDVPFSWNGREVPQPIPPPGGYPSGPVISLSAQGVLRVDHAEFFSSRGGAPLAATVLTQDNDAHLSPRDMSIIPWEPLEPGGSYVVIVSGEVEGTVFEHTWSFQTRLEGCTLERGSCGSGRACYPRGDALACLWEGLSEVDEGCRAINDCSPGLTCVGATCRPVCATEDGVAGVVGCDFACPDSVLNLAPSAGVGACLADGCGLDGCADAQGCYYVTGGLVCAWAGAKEDGAKCDYANDCLAGSSCLGSSAAAPTCHRLCGAEGLPTCETTCSGDIATISDESGLRACL